MKILHLALLLVTVLLSTMTVGCRSRVSSHPTITLTPETGSASLEVTVHGQQFPPLTEIMIRLGPPDVGASPQAYAHATTNQQGTLQTSFILPDTWPDGSLIVEENLLVIALNEDGSVKATAPFTYQPAVVSAPALFLNPGNGRPGQIVKVSGERFLPEASLHLQMVTALPFTGTAPLTTVTTDQAGTLSVEVTIPSRWPGTGEPVQQQSLFIEALDPDSEQRLALVPFFNIEGKPPAQFYQPLTETECENIRQVASSTLALSFIRSERAVPFWDLLTGLPGTACRLSADGTGSQLPPTTDLVVALQALFTREDWTTDSRYAADGPSGTFFAFHKQEALAVVQVEWYPAPGNTCGSNRSASHCLESLSPQQIIYAITIDLVEATDQ